MSPLSLFFTFVACVLVITAAVPPYDPVRMEALLIGMAAACAMLAWVYR